MRAELTAVFLAITLSEAVVAQIATSDPAEVKVHRVRPSALGDAMVLLEAKNTSVRVIGFLHINCTAFDQAGNPIGVRRTIIRNLKPSESDRDELSIDVAPRKAAEAKTATCRVVSAD